MNGTTTALLLHYNKLKSYFIKLDDIVTYINFICKLTNKSCSHDNTLQFNEHYLNRLINTIEKHIKDIDHINSELEKETRPIYLHIKEILIIIKNTYINLLPLEKKAQILKIKLDNTNISLRKAIVIQHNISDEFYIEITDIVNNYNKNCNYLSCNLEIYIEKLKYIKRWNNKQNIMFCDIFKKYSHHLKLHSNHLITHSSIGLTYFACIGNNYSNDRILDNIWHIYIKATKVPIFIETLIRDVEIMIIKANTEHNIHTIFKLETTIMALKIFIQPYIDIMDDSLLNVTNIIKIISFSESMNYFYDNL